MIIVEEYLDKAVSFDEVVGRIANNHVVKVFVSEWNKCKNSNTLAEIFNACYNCAHFRDTLYYSASDAKKFYDFSIQHDGESFDAMMEEIDNLEVRSAFRTVFNRACGKDAKSRVISAASEYIIAIASL